MLVCYCTNIWNHHQGPVATELAKLLGDGFRLLLYQPLDHPYSLNRINMGWNLNPPNERWIVGPPLLCRDVNYDEQRRLAEEADVLIANNTVPYVTQDLLVKRHKAGKLNFRMGERFFKIPPPWWRIISPRKWMGRILTHFRYEAAHVHYLTMSHWCVKDLEYYWACKGRTWRWGYLTKTSPRCIEKPIRDIVRIGWCGRMIDWKQVDLIIRAVALLPVNIRRRCSVVLLGDGDEREKLVCLARDLGVSDLIEFRSSVTSSEALSFMEDLDVYIFPSNRKEGWGAALLEAMDKACVVIANESAGSTLEVVENGKNGFTFKDGDVSVIASRIEWLVEHVDARMDMGHEAWRTIQDWSPVVGARRLKNLLECILSGGRSEDHSRSLCALVR